MGSEETEAFVEYLTKVKELVTKEGGRLEKDAKWEKVAVVVGNEACDLDSAVTSLVYAFHLSQCAKADGSTVLVVPVLNIPKDEFAIKTEVVFALNQQNIHQNELLFRDDVNVHGLHRAGKLQLILLDHHLPEGVFSKLSDAVVEIIDHHTVDSTNPTTVALIQKVPHTIQSDGSCATLVAEKLLIPSISAALSASAVASYLLYQAILVDTVNLSSKVSTDKDREMAKQLKCQINRDGKVQCDDDAAMVSCLRKVKGDIAALSVDELLRKDMKRVDVGRYQVSVSTVPVLTESYFSLPDSQTEIERYCQRQKMTGVVVLGTSGDRDMLLFSFDVLFLKQLIEGLQKDGQLKLNEVKSFPSRDERYRCFTHKSSVTRKQILPLLHEILASTNLNHRGEAGRDHSETEEDIDELRVEHRARSSDAMLATATPPNSYAAGGWHGSSAGQDNAHSVFTNLNQRVRQMERTRSLNLPGNATQENNDVPGTKTDLDRQKSFDYDVKTFNEPFTPSNTFVSEEGGSLLRQQYPQEQKQERNLLENKMAQLKEVRDAADQVDWCCHGQGSPIHSGRVSQQKNRDVGEDAMFDMDPA